jgi:hypothetical protein
MLDDTPFFEAFVKMLSMQLKYLVLASWSAYDTFEFYDHVIQASKAQLVPNFAYSQQV